MPLTRHWVDHHDASAQFSLLLSQKGPLLGPDRLPLLYRSISSFQNFLLKESRPV